MSKELLQDITKLIFIFFLGIVYLSIFYSVINEINQFFGIFFLLLGAWILTSVLMKFVKDISK